MTKLRRMTVSCWTSLKYGHGLDRIEFDVATMLAPADHQDLYNFQQAIARTLAQEMEVLSRAAVHFAQSHLPRMSHPLVRDTCRTPPCSRFGTPERGG